MTSPDSPTPPPNEHVASCRQRVIDVMDQARESFGSLTAEQLGWSPDPKSWGVGACLEHLNVTGSLYYPRIETAIERARNTDRRGAPDFRPGWFARFFHRFVEPEGKSRVKAPKLFQPAVETFDPTIVERFVEQQSGFQRLIESADGVELNRVKFATPVSRFLRFSVGEGIWILSSHLARHLGQAERVMNHEQFPKAS